MTFLVILGFVLFGTLAVFGLIDFIKTIQRIDRAYQEQIDKVQEELDQVQRERLQYLAGIITIPEVSQVPVKLEPEIVGELLAESETEVWLQIERELKKEATSKQYTRR
jgi:predicted PurR-regulated permease PerM